VQADRITRDTPQPQGRWHQHITRGWRRHAADICEKPASSGLPACRAGVRR
jgi:hypothetical protein